MRWSWFDLKSVSSGYCLKSYLENRGLKVFFKINLFSIANDVETLTRFIHVHARKFFTAGRTFHYQIHHLQVTLVPELISLMSWFFQITFKLWLAIVAMLLGIKADEIYWVAHIGSVLSSFLAALFASFLNCGSALFSAAETFFTCGSRWLNTLAAAGGKTRLMYLGKSGIRCNYSMMIRFRWLVNYALNGWHFSHQNFWLGHIFRAKWPINPISLNQ